MSTRRKMLAADEEIANRVVEMAQKRGQTVFQTVNDILEQALRVDGIGLTLTDVVNERGMLEKAKQMGLTFTIENLLYDVVELAHSNAEKNLTDLWLETGKWYGKYFTQKSDDGLDAFRAAMDLLTIGNSVYNIELEKDGVVFISYVSERFNSGYIEVCSKFIEGVFDSFDMELLGKENSKGVIRMKFRPSK